MTTFNRRLIGATIALMAAGCQSAVRTGTPLDSAPSAAELAGGNSVLWLDSLDLSSLDQDWGTPQPRKSVNGQPLTLNGVKYDHGIGTHSNSELSLELNGGATQFDAIVGLDDEVMDSGSVVFIAVVDGRERLRTPTITGKDPPRRVSMDLRGAKQLTLLVDHAGDNIDHDHANWAAARIQLQSASSPRPTTRKRPAPTQPVIAVMQRGGAPRINSPRITGGTPGRPFMFRIPATGQPPLKFSAVNLPAGISLDPSTGILSGSLTSAGRSVVFVTVEGPTGQASSRLTIVAGPDALALTPPMGWNSWNVWGTAVDDARVRAAADAMVNSGLAGVGFAYINIDDGWEAGRDANGMILCNEKFPDMRGLADYVHSKGLKLGIYSSPGPQTCAGYEGSYQHEEQDARRWAEWGIDLVKYDWCTYAKIAPKEPKGEDYRKPYRVMRAALDKCNRDIIYSLCQYGMDNVWTWGDSVGGHYWRTTGDITDTWGSMWGIAKRQAGLTKHAGPGHWNDPDMLIVGKVGWGPTLHDTKLTRQEQVTHITMWSLLASPLLIGCDMSQMDDFTHAVLGNPEVMDVNQDALGKQADRVATVGRTEVWSRPLSDGSHAVGLFNTGRDETRVTVKFASVGARGRQVVRDLWQRKDIGEFRREYSAPVPGHGAVMLRLSAPAD